MDPLVLTAVVVGSVAATATAIANWRLGRDSTRAAQAVRDAAEAREAEAAGLTLDGDRWRGQRMGRDVSVAFTHSSSPDVHGRGLGAIGHVTCAAHQRATFVLDDAELASDLGLDIKVDDATIDPFVRIRGSDAVDVRALFSAPVRDLVRDQLSDDVRPPFFGLRVSAGGNNHRVRLPRFRRLWLDDTGLHVEWHHDRIDVHTKTSLASFTVDYLAVFASELERAMSQPQPPSSSADASTAAGGSVVAIRAF